MKSYMNWSGGKDSSLSLFKILQDNQYHVGTLLTNINATNDRISMHGVRRSLLQVQADALGFPLQTIELPEQPSMKDYEQAVQTKVNELKLEGYNTAIFGDIFLEDLKIYREQKMAAENIQCVFPLWKMDTRDLMLEFIHSGFKAIVVCINEQYLDKSFCGRLIDENFLADLPSSVDPCGENGEYHSFVYDGPIFNRPVAFQTGKIVRRTYPAPGSDINGARSMNQSFDYGFYFCDLVSP